MRRSLLIAALALLLFSPAFAQTPDPQPGDPCSVDWYVQRNGGPQTNGVGHTLICVSGAWQSAFSFDGDAQVTKIGNQSCNTGEILKFDGIKWVCAADATGTGDNLGDHTATSDLNLSSNNLVNGGAVNAASAELSGNLAAVTATLTGSIKIGNEAASCTSGRDGAIRYLSASDPPWEYCDGGTTSWRPFKQPRCQDDGTGECYLDADRFASDPNFIAANIADGVNILGVTGTLADNGDACIASMLCPSIGDVCGDGDPDTVNDPIFAGFVAYNDPTSVDLGECKRIYVTDNNQAASAWRSSGSGDNINPDSTEDGQLNHANLGAGTFPAFDVCANLTDGGFADWYLPAQEELHLLWKNKAAIDASAAGSFIADLYLSSTESGSSQAFQQNLGSGVQTASSKSFSRNVRCVRRDDSAGGGVDTTPDAFSFTDQTAVALNTVIESNIVAIGGFSGPISVSITGNNGTPQFRIDGGTWTTTGSIESGQTLQLRVTSSSSEQTVHTANVTVGSTQVAWNVRTETSCELPWGEYLPHGDSVTTYDYAWNPSQSCTGECKSLERTCNDGDLSGTPFGFQYQSCADALAASNADDCPGSCGSLQTVKSCGGTTVPMLVNGELVNWIRYPGMTAAECKTFCQNMPNVGCCEYSTQFDPRCWAKRKPSTPSTASQSYYNAFSCN